MWLVLLSDSRKSTKVTAALCKTNLCSQICKTVYIHPVSLSCRAAGEKFGFAASVEPRKITTYQAGPGQPVDAEVLRQKAQEIIENGREDEEKTVELPDSMSELSVSESENSPQYPFDS